MDLDGCDRSAPPGPGRSPRTIVSTSGNSGIARSSLPSDRRRRRRIRCEAEPSIRFQERSANRRILAKFVQNSVNFLTGFLTDRDGYWKAIDGLCENRRQERSTCSPSRDADCSWIGSPARGSPPWTSWSSRSGSPRARSAVTWRRSTWPGRSSGRTAGRSSRGEVRAMPAFDERTGTAAAEKRAIGQAAAALIDDGDTVLLDGGTTTLEVARALLGRPVQVVTNSLPIAQLAGLQQGDRPDPDRRLRLPPDRRGPGPAGDRDDAGHPGPQGDPGGGRDRGRGGLQLEPRSWSRPSGR